MESIKNEVDQISDPEIKNRFLIAVTTINESCTGLFNHILMGGSIDDGSFDAIEKKCYQSAIDIAAIITYIKNVSDNNEYFILANKLIKHCKFDRRIIIDILDDEELGKKLLSFTKHRARKH